MVPLSSKYSYGYVSNTPNPIKKLQDFYDSLRSKNPDKPLKSVKEVAEARGLKQQYVLDYSSTTDSVNAYLRWLKYEPFRPSSEQIKKYIKWKKAQLEGSSNPEDRKLAKKYRIPTDYKGKETTRKDELKELAESTLDPFLDKVMDLRSLETNKNNYLPNWAPGLDGRVHSTFQWVPPTAQLNTISPNCQNLSKHTRVGQWFRLMVEAPPGYWFLSFDKSRFHVAMMGYLAKSKKYIRFATLDSHTIFGSWTLPDKKLWIDLDADDETILEMVKFIKKKYSNERDTKWKPTVLGNQLGLGARKLYWMNRRSMSGIKEAERLQDIIKERFPEVERFKKDITHKAHEQHYLINEFGVIRWFWNVFFNKFNERKNCWEEKHGEDYEAAIAQLVQSDSFGQMGYEWEKMVSTPEYKIGGYEYGLWDKYGFCNTIHDSNDFCTREELVPEAIERIFDIMCQPCEVLSNEACPEGLVVKAGISIGVNVGTWRDKEEDGKPVNLLGMREFKTPKEAIEGFERFKWERHD